MKWINLSLIIIWLCLVALGLWWAWIDFGNATTISGGGYLYDDNGNVIGLWDRWELANYPTWMFSIWATVYILTSTPYWWMILFWGTSILLLIINIFPHLLTAGVSASMASGKEERDG